MPGVFPATDTLASGTVRVYIVTGDSIPLRTTSHNEPNSKNLRLLRLRPGPDPAFAAAARKFGQVLAENGIGLVYGGGSVGLMGELANAVLDTAAR